MQQSSISRQSVKRIAQEYRVKPGLTTDVVIDFFESLDTPTSLAACLLFKYGEHKQLLELDVSINDYSSNQGDLFHRNYLAVSFLSKSSSLKTGYDKKAKGFAKFLQFEALCKDTNSRFKSDSDLEKSEYATWLFVMRRKIDLILNEFDIEEFFDNASWGPGVSTLLKGEDTSATRKFQHEVEITREAHDLLGSSLAAAYPSWFDADNVELAPISEMREPLRNGFYIDELGEDNSLKDIGTRAYAFNESLGNTIVSVPKNSKIDRIIAVEPGLNLFFQKAIGQMIKRRLRARGIDLTNQSINQRWSLQGSIDGSIATVDFSSASDSISKNLIRHLLPVRWYTVMNALRCKRGSFEGSIIEWEKFSSMGNGFTFELESLIFYAAALTSCEMQGIEPRDCSVYGDDVIIPTAAFDSYAKFCKFLGFTVNTDKSFCSGPFRESCGAHYFAGFDVKPIYFKEDLSDAFSVFKLANSIRRLAHRRNFNYGCDRRFLGVWRSTVRSLPVALRTLKIPNGFGDGGLVSNFDEACPPRLGFQLQGFQVLSIVERGVKKPQSDRGLLLERLSQISGSYSWLDCHESVSGASMKRLHGLSTLAYRNDTMLRGRTSIDVCQLQVFEWSDVGSWT